ncbi:MAG: 50S ribosomal protein L1 [Holosporales bacterium]|jgi:large subunit ribosomal protein L1|nr:50S ribosomal protein L1 [Holosporales bacterium]
MAKLCKRLKKIHELIDFDHFYSLSEAIAVLKKGAPCKFDETVDIAVNLNIDPRKTEQNIRGMITMPNGTGKSVRVAVFAKGPKADEAKAAGADLIGADDLAESVSGGKIDFDVCIATPDMMGVVGKLGKLLGPKGLMPNPKLGTVTQDVATAVKSAKGGQVEYKLEKAGIIHAGICKLSFDATAIEGNIKAFLGAVLKAKPTGVKGSYLKRVSVSTTMGPGIQIDVSSVASD